MRTRPTRLARVKSYLALGMLAFSLPASAEFYCFDSTTGTGTTWYMGNPYYGAGSSPDYCWATNNELQYIRQHFSGLRIRSASTVNGKDMVTWFGDDAEFLVNNL